jgi:predicted dehydrogenase
MIHDLDIILNLVQSPVVKYTVLATTLKSALPDIATVQLLFANGTVAHLVSSRAAQIKKRTMVVHQEDAFIELDFTTQDILIHRHATSSIKIGTDELKYRQEGTIERIFVYKDNPLKAEIEHFVCAIETGTKLLKSEQDLNALSLTLSLEEEALHANDTHRSTASQTPHKTPQTIL